MSLRRGARWRGVGRCSNGVLLPQWVDATDSRSGRSDGLSPPVRACAALSRVVPPGIGRRRGHSAAWSEVGRTRPNRRSSANGLYQCRNPVAAGAEHAIERAARDGAAPARVSAAMILSSSASITGSATPARLREPLVAAACEENSDLQRPRPGVDDMREAQRRHVEVEVVDAVAILHGIDDAQGRVDAERREILDEGQVMRLEARTRQSGTRS